MWAPGFEKAVCWSMIAQKQMSQPSSFFFFFYYITHNATRDTEWHH